MRSYRCAECQIEHALESDIGRRHLGKVLTREQFGRGVDFISSAASYGYITENSQQYLRDTQVFDVLGEKFSRSGMFQSTESAQDWLNERMAVNASNMDQVLRRLQGDGAGEVDALRQVNGSLRGLIHEAKFPTGPTGSIPSNQAGFDLEIVNRFTGDVVERVQVKSNWSTNPEVLKETVRDFLSNGAYTTDMTLAGPQELIDVARDMEVPNKLVVVGDVEGNRLSGERLMGLVESGDAATQGALSFQGVAERVGEGAVIGAAVAVTLSAIGNFIAYRQGRISGAEAFKEIAVDASRGAVVGGAMGGLSLLFPPGAVGVGIGIVVGMQLRRIVDIAYGKGAYLDLVRTMGAVEASVRTTADGVAVIERSISWAGEAQRMAEDELVAFAETARETDAMLEKLRKFEKGGEQ